MSDKDDIDWLAVEADYRPNILSLRAIGDKYGCTEGAIRKRAKKEGWVRDLSEKIKSRADDLVRRELVRNSTQNESDIINANATNSASIQIAERKDVSKARDIVMSLFGELEHQVNNKELYEKLGEILEEQNESKMVELYRKVSSFTGRVGSMKSLSDALKTMIELERRVYKIDDQSSDHETYEEYLKRTHG